MKNNIEEYLNHNRSEDFKNLLFSYIDRSGYEDSDIYKKAGIDRKLFSKIRCIKGYVPSKKTIIKLGIALHLNKKNLNSLLNSAGYTLTMNDTFDLIISYSLDNNIYDFDIINNYLYTYAKAIF